MTEDESKKNPAQPEASPPGDFISDDLRTQTARFLEELKRRLDRSEPEDTPKLGPPNKRH